MQITKRDGTKQAINFNKIATRIRKLCTEMDKRHVDPTKVAQTVIAGAYDGISTVELDQLAAETAASMAIDHPDYALLAGRLATSTLHKETDHTFIEGLEILNADKRVSDETLHIAKENAERISELIDYDNDYTHDFFSIKTLERSYLLRNNEGKLIERPQDLWMRVSIGIHGEDWENVEKTYTLLSEGYMTHATPTLFNAGTDRPQMSSCFLLDMDDDIEGLFKTLSDAAKISKWAGGIGVNLSKIRAKDSFIGGTGGKSDGIVPLLKTFNETMRWINQCFDGNTRVITKEGVKLLNELTYDDLVMDETGKFVEIDAIFKYDNDKDMVALKSKSMTEAIRVTEGHPIIAIDAHKRDDFYKDKLPEVQWKEAGELKVGDFIGQAIPSRIIPTELTEQDCRILGIILGDGHASKNEWGISFNSETDTHIEFVREYLNDKGIHTWEANRGNCTQIRWTNTNEFPFDPEDVYNANGNKQLNHEFHHLPPKHALQVVRGAVESDGGIYRGNEIHFYSGSEQLISDVKLLLLRNGIPAYLTVNEKPQHEAISADGRLLHFKESVCFDLRIPADEALAELLQVEAVQRKHWFIQDGYLFTRLNYVQQVEPSEIVYDLKIKSPGRASYTLDGMTVHNGGRRKGSLAFYLEPWHADIEAFLDAKKPHGAEELRARDLFYAIYTNDVFMERVEEDGTWSLMCPNECPDLTETYGQEFRELYEGYEAAGKHREQIPARKLWAKIVEATIETGVPYMTNKDRANETSMQKNIGIIRSSNLCNEILLHTSKDEIAVCNLASLALPKFVEGREFNFDLLSEVAYQAIVNLNNVIDRNFYPVPETYNSNMRNRPIGLGVQGLADVFAAMKIPFESEEAAELNAAIFEAIYFGAVSASADLAVKHGAYSRFEGSPWAEGTFHFDQWDGVRFSGRYDWNELKAQVQDTGVYNSVLTALMPTASTSQILGNNECFEPFTSNLYLRRTLSGEFVMVNKHLIEELTTLGMWNDVMRNKILEHNGSIQSIIEIPEEVREVYKTVWEIKQKSVIELAAGRAPFIDQTQSMNLFFDNPNMNKISSALMYGWKQGLKTLSYYVRSNAAASAVKFTVPKEATPEEIVDSVACSLDDPDSCISCGS